MSIVPVSSYEIRLSSSGPESLLTSFSSGTRLDPEALAQESDDLDPVAPGVVKNIIIDVVNGSEVYGINCRSGWRNAGQVKSNFSREGLQWSRKFPNVAWIKSPTELLLRAITDVRF